MEKYLYDKLVEEINQTDLYNDEQKITMLKYVESFNDPLYDAELTTILQSLIDYRLKNQTSEATAFSEIRTYIENLMVKIKDDAEMTESEKEALLEYYESLKVQYRTELIQQ
jgi:hypothetical protein